MELSETLPSEIMIDILYRLPAKSLLRFKSVSTSWYDLISDSDFAKHHLHRSLATQSNLHFVFRKPALCIGDFDSFDNAVELNYPFKTPEHGGASIIGSCHGLFCLWNFDLHNFTVFLFNPITRTHRILPSLPKPSHVAHLTHKFIIGFGYDSAVDDYKFIRIFQCSSEDTGESYSELMVYSLKMNSWSRGLDHVPVHFDCKFRDGVLVDEKLHWVNGTKPHEPPPPIVSFNLSTHSFGEVPVPKVDMLWYCYMHVGELDGFLCVLITHVDESEIFIMKEYGVADSWAKLFRVVRTTIMNMERTIAFVNDRKALLVRFAFMKLASIDLETLAIENLSSYDNLSRRLDAHVCVENLLMLDYFSDLPDSDEESDEGGGDGEEEEGIKKEQEIMMVDIGMA